MISEQRIDERKRRLKDARRPVQQRSRQRREEILQVTGALLERVGFNDLTTTLVARELGISVGSLYHYFPHKQAILYAMGEHWLAEYSAALTRIANRDLEQLTPASFVEMAVTQLLAVYRQQRGMMPLVHAMNAVPELRELDERHDHRVVTEMAAMFERVGIARGTAELQRLARLWLELTHALLLIVLEQRGARATRSRADLVKLGTALLSPS